MAFKTGTLEKWVKSRLKLGFDNPEKILKDIIKERPEITHNDIAIGRIVKISQLLLEQRKSKEEPRRESRIEILIPALDSGGFRVIHPAIDFIDDVCYVGTRIPCKNEETDRVKLGYVLISEKGEITQLNSISLSEKEFELETQPMDFKPRWSFKAIKEFIDNPQTIMEVDIKDVYSGIRNQLKYYIYFEEDEIYDVLGCWIIGTYFYQLFNKYPYFQLKGIQGSGKSKTAKIVGWTSFNGQLGIDYSRSSVFRLVNSTRGTLVIDENENLGSRNEKKANIEDLLNSGFEKGFPVPRVERIKRGGIENFKLFFFDVYCPKFISNIKGISKVSTLERTLEFTMVKCGKKIQGNREPEYDDSRWAAIRDTLYICLFKYWRKVKDKKNKVREENSKELSSRDSDVWLPILSIAKLIGKEIYEKMKEVAIEQCKLKKIEVAEKSREASLLRIFLKKDIFENIYSSRNMKGKYGSYLDDDINKTPKYYVKDIVDYLVGSLNWNPEFNTSRSIGRIITTIKCFVKKGNDGNGIWYQFTPKRLQEIKESFGWEFEEEGKNET